MTPAAFTAAIRAAAGLPPESARRPGLPNGRYNFRPHCNSKARLRRLKQIAAGQLDVDPKVRGEAITLLWKVRTAKPKP